MASCQYPVSLVGCYAIPKGFDEVHKPIASKSLNELRALVYKVNDWLFAEWWGYHALPFARQLFSQIPPQILLSIEKACGLKIPTFGPSTPWAAAALAVGCPFPKPTDLSSYLNCAGFWLADRFFVNQGATLPQCPHPANAWGFELKCGPAELPGFTALTNFFTAAAWKVPMQLVGTKGTNADLGLGILSLFKEQHARFVFAHGLPTNEWQSMEQLEPRTALGIGWTPTPKAGWLKGEIGPKANIEQKLFWIQRQALAWYLVKGGAPLDICAEACAPTPDAEVGTALGPAVLGGINMDKSYCWTPVDPKCGSCWAVNEIASATNAAFQIGISADMGTWAKFVNQICN